MSNDYSIQTTIIQDCYAVEEEQEKFKWADVVIYQTPIYWFSVPSLFKKYIDEVFAYGVFFSFSEEGYGKEGSLKGKKYMFSTTWNAPESEFNDSDKFFERKELEAALIHLHDIHKYIGMEPLKSFGAYDVVANPDVEKYLIELRQHLQTIFS